MNLPIGKIEDEFVDAYRERNRIILSAPTGSGKSTQVPQILLKKGLLNGGELLVLQPRRIAARALARRVAHELGERMGERIGYQIRNDTVVSRNTVVRFVTEGILLRKFINDPTLSGVSGIVFDEFHERSLHADMALARALRLQKETRAELRIVVMSATLDSKALETYLDPCRTVVSEGRVFPVEISHVKEKAVGSKLPIWEIAAKQVSESVKEIGQGHALVFMPGAYEIGRTIKALGQRLSASEFRLLPLHSELGSREQDAALDASDRRKIIVSTNVAETSLTIDDVRLVVDSGQARVARYDPARGLNTLWIEKISHASARQRTGRAGRTGPGKCIRLWSEREHSQRPEFDEPEIHRMDISESLLTLLATGIDILDTFEWFERPSDERMSEAKGLLSLLGVIDEEGRLSSAGRRMAEFPLHPRYGAMMLAADRYGCVEDAALAAAIAQSQGIFLRKTDREISRRRDALITDSADSDLLVQIQAWKAAKANRYDLGFCREMGIYGRTARQVEQIASQILDCAKYADIACRQSSEVPESSIEKSILAGFPDRVCRRLDHGTLRCEMTGQVRGSLARESKARDASLLVACEITEIGHQRGDVTVVFGLCSEIKEEWLKELYPKEFESGKETVFDEKKKRVVERIFTRYRDLDIECRENLDVSLELAAAELAKLIESGKAKLDKWDACVENYLAKVELLASCFPEYEIELLDEEARSLLVEQCCHGAKSLRDLKKQEAMPVLKSWFGTEVDQLVQSHAPDRLRLENGRSGRLRYAAEGAILSAKIQELYDLSDTPTICEGRYQPRIEILAPNMRPVQLTESLPEFWESSYPNIKKELKGRYPKHEWR